MSIIRNNRPPSQPPTVLVVEDEEVMQRFYACFFDRLHRGEFSWQLAKDGDEALRALQTSPPDLILLDWMLPGVPGPAVLKALRQHPATRLLGVLVVTARNAPGDAACALESGADDYLTKPFDERVLLARVRSLLRRHQALRSVEEKLRQSQKLEVAGLLAGGMVHNFNNFLTAIQGYADFLVQSLPLESAQRADAESIRMAVDQAASLTRQFLAFSHKQLPHPVVMDLNETVETVARMLRRLIGEDIRLELCLDPALQRLTADPGQMAQVLLNLALNARDAMPSGGRLAIATANEGREVVLSVSDTGTGMDAEVLARLFEPFFTTKAQGQGTGLGLASTRDIVERCGGRILADSQPGVGSRFRVYLPPAEAAPAASAGAVSRPAPEGRETILLVEDDPAVRQLGRRYLEGIGYRVLAAADAAQAEQCLAGPAPALLVTDVVLPGRSGVRLAQDLARRLPGLRTLLLSGYNDEVLSQHGALAPGWQLLRKPFAQEALGAKVRELLDAAPQI